MSEILPCPFCGDHAVSFQTKDGSWHVSCEAQNDEECRGVDGGELDGFINERFAIEAWNKRRPSSVEQRTVITRDAVHKVCEYRRENHPSGHCQKCPEKINDERFGEIYPMCYQLAEEMIEKSLEAVVAHPSPSEEAIKAAAKQIQYEMMNDKYPEAGYPTVEYLAGIISKHLGAK